MQLQTYATIQTDQCIFVIDFFSFLNFFDFFVFVNKVTTQRYFVEVLVLTLENMKLISLVYLNMLIN